MKTDITRQISASVYQNSTLRDNIFAFIKDKYHSVAESCGLDTDEVIKHTLNARQEERNYYLSLFIPSIVLWGIILIFFLSSDFLDPSINVIIGVGTFFVSLILVILREINLKKFLKNNLSKNSYNYNFIYQGSNSNIIQSFQNRNSSNVTFYSGYSPFVGSGLDIGGWSLVIDVDKGKKVLDTRLNPETFEEYELYNSIAKEIESLLLPNMVIKDKVFINGRKIRGNKNLLPDPMGHPVNNVPNEFVNMVMNNDIKDARFYKVFQVIDWEGDLVLSAFFRLQKNDKTLFIENNYFLLPPISDEFKAIDKVKEESGIRHLIKFIVKSLLMTIGHTLFSILKVYEYVGEGISGIFGGHDSEMREIVKRSPDFDYGSETSIRESVSQTNYSQHFQKLDKERYFKTIEKRIFNILGDFLDSKNIDTSEFRERETSILNHGIIVSGGNIASDNLTVGKNSKINITNK